MTSPSRRACAGFTLLELMFVTGIIGILAAVALPAYQDYILRARVAEGLELGRAAQKNIAEYYDRWGVLPRDNAAAGLPAPALMKGAWVDGIDVAQGVLSIRFSEALGKDLPKPAMLVMRPAIRDASPTAAFAWVCQNAPSPAGTRVAPLPAAASLLESKHLPSACRPR